MIVSRKRWSVFHRLRKYARKKRAHSRYVNLYWRYHFQFYGPHVNLWGEPTPTARRK